MIIHFAYTYIAYLSHSTSNNNNNNNNDDNNNTNNNTNDNTNDTNNTNNNTNDNNNTNNNTNNTNNNTNDTNNTNNNANDTNNTNNNANDTNNGNNNNDNNNTNNNANNNNGNTENIVQYSQLWAQRTLNRDQTAKGRYPTKTEIGGAESLTNYSKYFIDTWNEGANINSDNHGTYSSNFVNNRWRSNRTTHSEGTWRNPETKDYPAKLKAHDNIVEVYNNQIKSLRQVHRGLGQINFGKQWQRQGWMSYLDWINCFTNGTPKDICVTFLQHLSLLLDDQIESLLKENKWKEQSN